MMRADGVRHRSGPIVLCVGLAWICVTGCAGTGAPESESSSGSTNASAQAEDALRPVPAHPFPSWVAAIQSGTTRIADVTSRFGPPTVIDQSPSGDSLYRFVHAEIHWADDDPARPRVAADGSLHEPEPSFGQKVGSAFGRTVAWFDRNLFYPPRQPRPQSPRMLPATIHNLWVDVAPDGIVRGVDYSAEQGSTPDERTP